MTLRSSGTWVAQWTALGLSLPGLLFGWAVIAWSCFVFIVSALLLKGLLHLYSHFATGSKSTYIKR